MGWETSLITSINYNRKTYNSKYEVEEDLNDIKSLIKKYESDLKSLSLMTEPSKFMSKEDLQDYTPLDWIESKFNTAIEELEWLYIDKWKLEILLEEWDKCHSEKGLAIPIVKYNSQESKYDDVISNEDIVELWLGKKAFLDGDFVKTIYTENES